MYINNSLEHVAKRIVAGVLSTIAIKEHVDTWNKSWNPKLFETEPPRTGDPVIDAYMAGTAHYESAALDLPCPAWAMSTCRFLSSPVHFGFGPRSREMEMEATPNQFRIRNVFAGPTSIRKPPDKQRRQNAVNQAVANSELSGVRPDSETQALLARYSSGEITLDDYFESTKARFKHLKPD